MTKEKCSRDVPIPPQRAVQIPEMSPPEAETREKDSANSHAPRDRHDMADMTRQEADNQVAAHTFTLQTPLHGTPPRPHLFSRHPHTADSA